MADNTPYTPVELTFDEFWNNYAQLPLNFRMLLNPTPEQRKLLELAWNLYYKVNRLASVNQYQVEFYQVVDPVVKYAPVGLLHEPYYLLLVIAKLWHSRMGEDKEGVRSIINCSMSASFLVRLNDRLKARNEPPRYRYEGWHWE